MGRPPPAARRSPPAANRSLSAPTHQQRRCGGEAPVAMPLRCGGLRSPPAAAGRRLPPLVAAAYHRADLQRTCHPPRRSYVGKSKTHVFLDVSRLGRQGACKRLPAAAAPQSPRHAQLCRRRAPPRQRPPPAPSVPPPLPPQVGMDECVRPTAAGEATPGVGSKVVVTLGPACQDLTTQAQLLQAGATCARIDLSWCGAAVSERWWQLGASGSRAVAAMAVAPGWQQGDRRCTTSACKRRLSPFPLPPRPLPPLLQGHQRLPRALPGQVECGDAADAQAVQAWQGTLRGAMRQSALPLPPLHACPPPRLPRQCPGLPSACRQACLCAAPAPCRRSVWLDTTGREVVVRRPVEHDATGWPRQAECSFRVEQGQARCAARCSRGGRIGCGLCCQDHCRCPGPAAATAAARQQPAAAPSPADGADQERPGGHLQPLGVPCYLPWCGSLVGGWQPARCGACAAAPAPVWWPHGWMAGRQPQPCPRRLTPLAPPGHPHPPQASQTWWRWGSSCRWGATWPQARRRAPRVAGWLGAGVVPGPALAEGPQAPGGTRLQACLPTAPAALPPPAVARHRGAVALSGCEGLGGAAVWSCWGLAAPALWLRCCASPPCRC